MRTALALGGSSFISTLPWGEEVVSEEPEVLIPESRNPVAEESVAEAPGGKFTILLVENNVNLLNLTRGVAGTWFKF